MRLALALPHYDFSFPDRRPATVGDVVEYARRAEAAGFDAVRVSDHLFLALERYGGSAERHGSPEAMTMLAAIASATSRVRLGPLVLCSAFRNPAVLGAEARSVDDLSGGRLDLALGAGWYADEYEAAGIPFGTPGERVARLAAVAGALTGQPAPRPPLWIGSKGGPKIARVIAEHADGWNIGWRITPEEFEARLATLHEACERAGRDPGSVRLSVGQHCLLAGSERDLAARYEDMQRWTPPGVLAGVSLAEHRQGTLAGTPTECAARIKAFEALGVEEIVLTPSSLPFAVHDDGQLAIIADELLPLVRP